MPRRPARVTLEPWRTPWARLDRVVAVVAAALVDARVGRRPFVVGVVLGLLSCMIVAWGLTLAAGTGSPLAGARVIAVLAAMTTLQLLPAVAFVAGVGARGRRRWSWLPAVPVLVSVLWLVMVGLAGFGVVEHRQIVVHVMGPRTVLLW